MYTTSSIFLKTLKDCGITHAFVNWGSDHPALLEELERQRVQNGKADLEIITCPNEMVALSAAQGFAQVLGRPAAVLVHVDVGTQALAGAVHNVDRGRVPVLIYAGSSPFTLEGELKGSRNEFIMGWQDIPDQAAIVRQYMRFTCQIGSGKNIGQVVMRGLQSAMSEPKGPVYLWARREVMEEDVNEDLMKITPEIQKWSPVEASALSPKAASAIAQALSEASKPLIITSYLGRNLDAVPKLVELSEQLAIPIYQSCPSNVNFPHTHPNFVGLSFGIGENVWVREADVILIIECDTPYIPMHNKPRHDAKIFHVDIDVLKDRIGMHHIDADLRSRADAEIALTQILHCVPSDFNKDHVAARSRKLAEESKQRIANLDFDELNLPADGSFTVPNILGALRKAIPSNSLVLNEGISNYPFVWSHMRPDIPGSLLSSGASSLGWGLGAAIGASLAKETEGKEHDLIVLVVGDGSFLFGVPASAYWIARRYNTPFLTIILNNGGWKSPKLSMLGVYPNGLGSKAAGRQLSVGFGPEAPDYSQIAVAAGGAWGKRISIASELKETIVQGIEIVKNEGRCAVIDCVIESI